jgi:dihydrofolate reductase
VYSTTLSVPSTTRTHIERTFDPDSVRDLKASVDRDLMIGGAELAAQALRAGLVDELQFVLVPTAVGGGKPALPARVRVDLELLDQRRFANGSVYLRYHIRA